MRRHVASFFVAPAVLLSLFLTATGCSVNPATGKRQLALISEAQEIQMGRDNDQQIVAALGIYPDEELQVYVDRLGQQLAASSERPQLPWTFRVIDDPMVNAFALPGGFIYITRGILSHMNSEAELVSVLGHEIGHVTARHTVSRLSKAQLGQLALIGVMVASEDARQFGDLAQAGLGILFLKYSRDDERQSDELGLRYLVDNGYDPNEMANVFETLGRASAAAGAGRIPAWLATHPAPEQRVETISAQVAAMPPEQRAGTINRQPYLEQLDGVVFGANPRDGFFEDNVFYHPDMAFQLTFPAGWETQNQRRQVVAVSPQQDAAVVLGLAQESSPDEALRAFFSQERIERGQAWRSSFYNFRTVPQTDAQGRQGRSLRGIVGFFEHAGLVFQLYGMSYEEGWDGYRDAAGRALGSFEVLRDRRYLEVQPARVDLVTLPRAMTVADFAGRYAPDSDVATIALINGLEEDARLERGRVYKAVVGGKLP